MHLLNPALETEKGAMPGTTKYVSNPRGNMGCLRITMHMTTFNFEHFITVQQNTHWQLKRTHK